MVALVVCSVAQSAFAVVYALALREVVDAAVAGQATQLWTWVTIASLLVLSQLLLRAIIRWLDELVRSRVENKLKHNLFEALLLGDYGRVSSVHTAEWMNRLTGDAKVVADTCVDIIPGLAGTLMKFVSVLVAILWLDARIAVILIPGSLSFALLTLVFRKRMRKLSRSIQEADGRLRVFIQERLSALLTVRVYVAEQQSLQEADQRMAEHRDARMRRNHFANVCNTGFGTMMTGANLAATAWCAYGLLTNTMSFGTLTAMVQLVSQAQAPIANLTGYVSRYYAMSASAERLLEAEKLVDSAQTARPFDEVKSIYEQDFTALGLDNVSYAYWATAEDPRALSKDAELSIYKLTLEVRKGEFLALAGSSGCGKSTTLRLLMGAYTPDDGQAWLGLGTQRLPMDESWRRLFAYVPQGNQLMEGSLREVVALPDPAAATDEERIWNALRIACADDFVSKLPDGLDTHLGEHGAGLSEGQMQRLSIARAIFSQSPILLLDEATSALDGDTEVRLLENLRALEDITVIVVTHRPAALTYCDRVITFTREGVC